jgi:single-stranded DNA-binding protein
MNSINLSGRVDSEPQLRGMPGRDVCEFWLLIPDARKEYSLYLKVITFKALAEEAAKRLSKGDWIAAGGYLRSERWPGSTAGRRLCEHTLHARHLDFGPPSQRRESS